MSDFVGSGSLNMVYTSYVTYNIPASIITTLTVKDTARFSLTYYYCNLVLLPAGIITFSAARENEATVKLDWTTGDELAGLAYEVEMGWDGQLFRSTGSKPRQSR